MQKGLHVKNMFVQNVEKSVLVQECLGGILTIVKRNVTMAVQKLDKLVRSFLTGISDQIGSEFDAFKHVQDPTYMSFKLNFFPLLGTGYLDDSYSACGLFRSPGVSWDNYSFNDSAAEYLKRIGSPNRQACHRIFTNLLWRLQDEAPWYFQSVTGLADLYKFDPAINFRGKDKVLTVECLESVDMRMTLLADLYRSFAFDFQYMREVLPINVRTFSMEVHVLEFRRFNTTFGVIADALGKRAEKGEDAQKKAVDNKNVYKTNLAAGAFNNLDSIGSQLSQSLGGLGGIFGGQPESDLSSLRSAFEAISVQTYILRDCEFDFYSEAPGYLDTVSVKDSPESTNKFKIKVGRIEKVTTYPFYHYILGEYIRDTYISESYVTNITTAGVQNSKLELSTPYSEFRGLEGASASVFSDYRESVYPTNDASPKSADVNAYKEAKAASDLLRRRPLERMLGGIMQNTATIVNAGINQALGEATGGILGTAPLGNVYDKPAIVNKIQTGLADFFTPGDQTSKLTNSAQNPTVVLKNIMESVPPPTPHVGNDIIPTPDAPLPWTPENIYD